MTDNFVLDKYDFNAYMTSFFKGNLVTHEAVMFVDLALNIGTSGKAAGWYRLDSDGDRGLNLIFDGYHEKKTVYVTYKHSKTWADLGEDGFNPDCITAKVTPVFKEILKCKEFEDYLSNNINHGNDFWARVVAQCIAESVL